MADRAKGPRDPLVQGLEEALTNVRATRAIIGSWPVHQAGRIDKDLRQAAGLLKRAIEGLYHRDRWRDPAEAKGPRQRAQEGGP